MLNNLIAAGTIMDITVITEALAGIKAAGEIAQSLIALNTSKAVSEKVAELNAILIATQGLQLAAYAQQTAMIEEIRTLKEEAMSTKAWSRQKSRYRLTAPLGGFPLVYAVKETASNREPAHWICTKCYEDRRRSILYTKSSSNGFILIACPTCGAEMSTGCRGDITPKYA